MCVLPIEKNQDVDLDFIIYNFLFRKKNKDTTINLSTIKDELKRLYNQDVSQSEIRKNCYQYVSSGLLVDNYNSYSIVFVDGLTM